MHDVGRVAAGGHNTGHCMVIDRDDDVCIGKRCAAADPVELSVQVWGPAVGRGDNAVLMACPALRIDTPRSRWLQRRAAAPLVCHCSHLLGSEARTRPMKHRQARASGQPRVATARRCLRSVSAVACCSSNGRGCGKTIAGRRAAATSATQLWPAWVITTSAAHMSGHGSGVQDRDLMSSR